MPVADHPVHESTKRADSRPACYNSRKPLESGYWAQDGWNHSGVDGLSGSSPAWVWVYTGRMTQSCQSDFPGCAGCKDFNQKGNTTT